MAKHTRLATTIASHPVKGPGAIDVYYTDGRTNDPSHVRSKDLTLDRTDQGFYFTIFASTDLSYEMNDVFQSKKDSLDRMSELAKAESKGNIDTIINDIAENAVELTGRLSLKSGNKRSSYYAGFIIKDSEMAAVTMGNGLAYLYRNDTLYPLTEDDYPMEAVNYAGNRVDNFDIYGAGRAGTIRYSNISQLQVDDCIVLCTLEVMETIGQQGMLDIMEQAYDQEEAAELVSHRMEELAPGTPFQFMMSFVEEIIPIGRMRRDRSNTEFFKTIGDKNGRAMTDETTRFDRRQIPTYSARDAGLVKDEPVEIESDEVLDLAEEEAREKEHFIPSQVDDEAKTHDYDYTEGLHTQEEKHFTSDTQEHEQVETAGGVNLAGFSTAASSEDHEEHLDRVSGGVEAAAFGTAVSATEYENSDYEVEDYDSEPIEDDVEEFDEHEVFEDDSKVAVSPYARNSAYRMDDSKSYGLDRDEEIKGEEVLVSEGSNERGGKILLTILILVLVGITLLAITYILRDNGVGTGTSETSSSALETTSTANEETTESSTESTTEATTEATTTEPTTEATTTREGYGPMVEGAEGGAYPSTYYVNPGDNFFVIIRDVYSNYNIDQANYEVQNQLIARIVEANPDTISGSIEEENVVLYADTTINIPDPSDLLDAE